MKVDIHPQYDKISNWYWNSEEGQEILIHRGMSLWDWLQETYGAKKLYGYHDTRWTGMWISFPNEESYTVFLLRWS